MFLFSKNQEQDVSKRNTLIFDYLLKIEKDLPRFRALYINTSKMQNQALKNAQRQTLIETFENVVKKNGGEIFGLANDDMVIIFNKKANEEVQACLIKIRFLLQDDPILKGVIDLEQSEFVKFFDLATNHGEFRKVIRASMRSQDSNINQKIEKSSPPIIEVPVHNQGQRKLRRELTPEMLDRVQKTLARTDFSSLIRRQSVCAVIGKSPPQMIFDEVFVSINDMRDMLLPDVDLTANPWLFQHLTATLDKRVLVSISQHDDGSLKSNFSLNLNVATILSDEFLAFDEHISVSMRSSIILELQLVDILSDVKAFLLARTFAQYRGYKVCIDTITIDRLEFLNKEFFDSDLIKIVWHSDFAQFAKESRYFNDNLDRSDRAKIILCRVDDPQAIEVGNSLGIHLYQGRLIQKMLGAQPRRVVYKL